MLIVKVIDETANTLDFIFMAAWGIIKLLPILILTLAFYTGLGYFLYQLARGILLSSFGV